MAINQNNESTKFSVEAGEAITQGDAVAIHTDGKAYRANAKTGANQQVPCKGFAETSVDSGAMVCVLTAGKRRDSAANWDEEKWIYLAETDGAVAHAAPEDSGDVVQIVGFAVSPTEMMIGLQPHTSL